MLCAFVEMQPGNFAPANNPQRGIWRWFDAPRIANQIEDKTSLVCVAPGLQFDALPESQDLPNGFQQKDVTSYAQFYVDPATHVAYATTWFSLTIAGTIMTSRLFRHVLRRGRR